MNKFTIFVLIGCMGIVYAMDTNKLKEQIQEVKGLIEHEQRNVDSATDARKSSSDPSEITSHMYDFLASKQRLAIQEEKLAQLLAKLAQK